MKKGTMHEIKEMWMPQLGRYRKVRIYLPPEYETSSISYPVIYMHDGQNLFDVASSSFGTIWDVATKLDELYEQDNSMAFIVVGVDNGEVYRYAEYCPWYSEAGGDYLPHAKLTKMPGGHGFEYLDFLANTLKPYVDEKYRTLSDVNHTGLMGSSMGGLISICGALTYPTIFGKVAALSSAVYFVQDELEAYIKTQEIDCYSKLYLDVGTEESKDIREDFPEIYVSANERIYNCLNEVNYPQELLTFKLIEGGIHSETAWKNRLLDIVTWLFKDEQ